MLCSNTNRVDLPGSPSTCALDMVITNIPSFLLLAFIAIYIPIRLFLNHRSKFNPPSKAFVGQSYNRYSYSSPSESPRRIFAQGFPRWVHYLYIFLFACLFALRVLEVVRLVLAHMGVALLPVGIVASVATIFMLAFGNLGCGMGRTRSLTVSASLVLYWASSTVFESIKVTRLVSYNTAHPAKGTDYPSSDWLLDNGCMLGLMVIFFFIEGAYLVLRWRSSILSPPEPVREMGISKPRPMSDYDDSFIMMDGRDRGYAIGVAA
ncbi:uncharacterized protein FOMMEDRAFT_24218 [Fomitiporia mediterranea MF3/22]|uniref:Uncharacterized protein n=1 Tax=Fomitiporia mediterranea (strain MF3/22) TaxID=694068 RepID=R7SHA3_FOMME|nr:uncharacterized protein FOMMEDRAFT_24218 [Fomitiporia mediterranea MF3/22]EJC97765.1 hypothetical protein FOMMEDRAFT_24218 [Fomitiporia mediterranea MF3/22]